MEELKLQSLQDMKNNKYLDSSNYSTYNDS